MLSRRFGGPVLLLLLIGGRYTSVENWAHDTTMPLMCVFWFTGGRLENDLPSLVSWLWCGVRGLRAVLDVFDARRNDETRSHLHSHQPQIATKDIQISI